MGLLDRITSHTLAVNDTVEVMPDFLTKLAGTNRGKLVELEPAATWRSCPIGSGKSKEMLLTNHYRGGIVQLGKERVRYPLECLTYVPK